MTRVRLRSLRTALVALAASLAVAVQPVAAQSVLRDAETEALFADMATPLVRAAGLDPANVRVVLLNDPSINAFVAGGQTIYVHSGLLLAADDANQVQGVIAHELGHIAGGHVTRFGEGAARATGISLLSLVLGAAAMAAGAGSAGAGILAAGQQAAQGSFLAFTRVQESSADAAGASYLNAAGISGRGSLEFFKKLENQELRAGVPQVDSFNRTHPLSGERINFLTQTYQSAPSWNTPSDPTLEARFAEVKAKLAGYLQKPQQTLIDYPVTSTTLPAHYARAYAYHGAAQTDKALAETTALLKAQPDNPYFLELNGQILLESGEPKEALAPLKRATTLTGNAPLIALTYGHALIEAGGAERLAEAERVLRAAVALDRDNPFAWYQLGVIYESRGDTARAQLATAERFQLLEQPQIALPNARAAMAGLPQGSPDWLRAQDIAMVAEQALKDRKGRRG